MPLIVSIKDSRSLSQYEFLQARAICEEARTSVLERPEYIRRNGIDPRFALPDANWSCDAANEFVQVFRRVCDADVRTLEHLRGLSQVFTGYNLYEACNARGLSVANLPLTDALDATARDRLKQRNGLYVALWRHMTQGIPRRFVFSPPRLLGEVGHDVDGVVVNADTCTFQDRVNLIYASGIADWIDRTIEATGTVRICEIGGGYGALCSWFKQAFPEATYTIVDLPESLLFSRLYVSLTRPDLTTSAGLAEAPHGVRFVPNYMAEQLAQPFDLVINTLSMSEMSEYQVRRYLALMKSVWLKNGGLFFEQNMDNRPMGLQCAETIIREEFPEQRSLRNHTTFLQEGSPNVWSLAPIRLTGKRIDFTRGKMAVRLAAAGGWKGLAGSLWSAVPRRLHRTQRTAA
jgi:putative sugar O-methyltransferase